MTVIVFSSFESVNFVEAENTCEKNVFISEIGWAGSSKGAADEWLELANIGESEIKLAGWIIEGAGTSNSDLSLPEGAQISPHSTYLIANYSSESDKSSLAVPPDYVNTAISLSNSSLRFVLKDQNGCQTDEAGDGGAPFFGGTGINGTVSMIRLEPLTSGIQTTAWTAADTSNGFDDNNDLGTPKTIKWLNLSLSSTEEIPELEPTILPLFEEESEPVTIVEEIIQETPLNPPAETENLETIVETTIEETTSETVEETLPETTEENPVVEIIELPQIEVEEVPVDTYSQGELLINEFVSDPTKDEKEWVEIINPNNTTVSLLDWKMSESSGRTANLPDIQLGYGQAAVAEFSSSALNNDSDTIRIIAPDGTVIDEIVYGTTLIPTTNDPYSIAKGADGNFVVTETPTKEKMNIITTTITVTKTEECETSTNSTSSISLSDQEEEEEEVTEIITETTLPNIRLSEIYPNTDGTDATDEFIELENYGSETIDLFGLTLKDAAENDWSFPDHQELPTGKFLAVSRTEYQFALNNSGSETVQLYSAGGTLLDQIQYEDALKKSTYARDSDSWRWTSIITPNEPNSFPEIVELQDNEMVRQNDSDLDIKGTNETKLVTSVTIAEARDLPKDTKVQIEGIVTVTPNIFGRQIFYLTDNSAGIQIYKSDGIFPELMSGDLIELNGTISSNRGEPRIKIGQEDKIVVITGEISLDVSDKETITEAEAGQLIRLAGMITEKSSDRFTIETKAGLNEIRIKENTGISLSELKPGDQIKAIGIVGQSEDKYFLLPRSPDDLVLETQETVVAQVVPTEPTGKQINESANQKNAIYIGLAVIIGLIIYYFFQRRSHKTKSYEKKREFSFAPTG